MTPLGGAAKMYQPEGPLIADLVKTLPPVLTLMVLLCRSPPSVIQATPIVGRSNERTARDIDQVARHLAFSDRWRWPAVIFARARSLKRQPALA